MKKLFSIILSVFLLIPSISPLADTENKEVKEATFDMMMENETTFGADNFNIEEKEIQYSAQEPDIPRNLNNIVVLIKFKDEEEFMTEEKSRQIESTYNEFVDNDNDGFADLGSISLKSYINDFTYGRTAVNSTFYPRSSNGTSYISITAPETKQYYEGMPMGGNTERDFIKWAFNSIKNEVKLSSSELDRNNDGEIDNVTFIYNGFTLNNKNMLWPHKTKFSGYSTVNGKSLGTYNIIYSGSRFNSVFNKTLLSVINHEFLHSLHLPDLYRYSRSGNPVGIWDIMSSTTGVGQLPLIYTRNLYNNMGINIGEITKDGTYKIKYSGSTNKNDLLAFKIKSPLATNEYFMVEYRKNKGNWDEVLPGSGLIVYRVNEAVNAFSGNKNGSPDHLYVFRPGVTNSIDGNGNLNNAFLSKESGRTIIGNSNLNLGFDANSLYFQNGDNSGIVISEIGSSSGDEISFKVTFPVLNGDGSKENPFKVYNASDLKRVTSNLDKHYILMNDIDLSKENWVPIGIAGNLENVGSFTGSINGNGHTISNMTINLNSVNSEVGLIGSIDKGGEVYNLNLENVNITSNAEIGSIAGSNNGIIKNVKVTGNIQSSSNRATGGISGDVGFEGTIENSISSVNIVSTATGSRYSKPLIGGISGQNYQGLTINNFANGKIQAEEGSLVGGLFGRYISPKEGSGNNYFDVRKTGQIKASAQDGSNGETTNGLIGIKMPEKLDINSNKTIENLVEYIPSNAVVNKEFKVLDEALATVTNGALTSKNKEGQTILQHITTIGTNKVIVETVINIQGGVIDRTSLNTEINNVKAIDKSKYTNESVLELEKELLNAETVAKNEKATQEEIDNAKNSLLKAVAKLTLKSVVQPPIVVNPSNEKPVINVENKSIKAYDDFDKMAGVKATDKEDGDITSKVKVIGDINTKVAGKYNLIYEVTDKDGNKVSKAIEVIVHKLPITLERSIGRDRYDTATKLSQIEFNKSDTVVIVNGSAIVDGLTATPLATYLKAPILLADKNTVPDETINEIRRLGATKAIIAGGDGVISENAVNKLKSLGINTVERIAGKNRYSTSLEIAKYIDRNFYDVSNVIVSSGVGEADALSIASVAGRDKMPIILVEKDMIPSEVYNWMENEDLQNAYIIGGTGVVNNTVLNLVNGITKNNISENRLGGKDRYETNAKVISKFYSNSLDKVYVAKALVLIDALTAGPVAAVGQAPVVLANGNLTETQRNTLVSKKANKVIQAGGGVSEEAVNLLKVILN
ncbi:hypothetical protein JCM1393_06480 [Clostridium carnis]